MYIYIYITYYICTSVCMYVCTIIFGYSYINILVNPYILIFPKWATKVSSSFSLRCAHVGDAADLESRCYEESAAGNCAHDGALRAGEIECAGGFMSPPPFPLPTPPPSPAPLPTPYPPPPYQPPSPGLKKMCQQTGVLLASPSPRTNNSNNFRIAMAFSEIRALVET